MYYYEKENFQGGYDCCCGNYGECMKVIDDKGDIHTVVGIKFTIPCPN